MSCFIKYLLYDLCIGILIYIYIQIQCVRVFISTTNTLCFICQDEWEDQLEYAIAFHLIGAHRPRGLLQQLLEGLYWNGSGTCVNPLKHIFMTTPIYRFTMMAKDCSQKPSILVKVLPQTLVTHCFNTFFWGNDIHHFEHKIWEKSQTTTYLGISTKGPGEFMTYQVVVSRQIGWTTWDNLPDLYHVPNRWVKHRVPFA